MRHAGEALRGCRRSSRRGSEGLQVGVAVQHRAATQKHPAAGVAFVPRRYSLGLLQGRAADDKDNHLAANARDWGRRLRVSQCRVASGGVGWRRVASGRVNWLEVASGGVGWRRVA
eukprot:365520-Chlamydomonas_euryale.AAC.16